MSGEIFISYRRTDLAQAELLYRLLKERGVDAWYDAHIGAGDDWRAATAQALVAAPVFVLLFSKSASQSDEIIKELSAATFHKKVVIPVRIEDIHPEGAFLYELASRNWFDAFNNTDARFAVLADQLAALVKGGAEARTAAGKLGATTPLVVKSKRSTALILGLLGFSALIVIAGALVALNPPEKPATPAIQPDRIAFYGFTAAGDDPALRSIAETATDETFKTMNALGLDIPSRSATQRVAQEEQPATARKLGATYTLAGDVRSQGDHTTISIRMEDIARQSTAWEDTISAPTSARESLPDQATASAANVSLCYIEYRDSLKQEDDKLLKLIARTCIAQRQGHRLEVAEHARTLALAAPDSARVQILLASALVKIRSSSPPPQATSGEEIDSALRKALKADPDNLLALLKKAGLYQYWIDSGTHPELCDGQPDKNIELCVALRNASRTAG